VEPGIGLLWLGKVEYGYFRWLSRPSTMDFAV
jgi:hypothetical protein